MTYGHNHRTGLPGNPRTAQDVGAKDLTGWPDQTSVTLSFNDGTRTMTITPTGASFYFYSNGTKFIKIGAQSIVIANTVGLHFVYFTSLGVLTESTTPWDLTSTTVPTAIVYWNGSAGAVGMELHNDDRDRHLHAELHHTVGTRFDPGYGNLLAGTFTSTTLSINTGRIWDEDLQIIISAQTACRLWYRSGADYTFESNVTVPAKVIAGALQYDNAGTLTPVGAAKFVTNWVYATNDITYPIYVAVGQAQHNTVNEARAAAELTFPSTLPTREWKLLYKVIFQNSGGTPTYIEAQDYRTSGSLSSGSITSIPASNVIYSPTAPGTAATSQAAIDALFSSLNGYRTLMSAAASHTAGVVAGTYALGLGDPAAVSGTGTLYPIQTIYIAAADYPAVDGRTAKLRIRAQLYTNDVAPTGNFTFGLYPITRPGTSGAAGVNIYTIGTVVTGSNGATFTTPAADGLLSAVGADFALPADGHYIIAVVTTATVAANAHVHMNALLQLRYT